MAKEKENSAAKLQKTGNIKYRDSSGKIIFEDPVLCSQFLRGYAGIPMLEDVRPEDIEDVTERYVHLFTEERNSDVVKKINLKDNPFYLVSLIEHKSDVDYNVAYEKMRSCQVLRKRRWKSWSKNTGSRKKRRRKRLRCTGKI